MLTTYNMIAYNVYKALKLNYKKKDSGQKDHKEDDSGDEGDADHRRGERLKFEMRTSDAHADQKPVSMQGASNNKQTSKS